MAKRGKKEPSLFDGDGGGAVVDTRGPGGPTDSEVVELHEAAQTRYLNYALSVITSRALPDVRDGLKPVQRRILYTMWQQNLTADAKHRKCAKVVGDVMGNYHPHGDSALYETLVRMAQSFSLRYPLIDGSGNFGSLDGDSAAAMRYTECRLARVSDELLTEIDQATVPFRPNYDGTRTEPVVLPSRIPNLLINGATGIAVGMATNIPPHNLNEICTALTKLLGNADLSSAQLCRYVKGPDFPTGGQMLNSPEELKEIYKTGSGAIRLRATWEEGPVTRGGKTIYITSIPYTVNKATLVERIADVALSRKLPPLVDVKDLSTDDVRIALELKKDADEKMVMAYLFKHTPLQTSFIVNLTCLIPTENPEVGRPERLDLHSMLWHFLHFRLDVVTKRLEHELASIKKRVHILEGFEKVFDALDEILKIVRKSEGKADAAQQIIKRFALDAEQTDAILELKIYRLARLEILSSGRSSRIAAAAYARSTRCSRTKRAAGTSSGSRSRRSRRSTATHDAPALRATKAKPIHGRGLHRRRRQRRAGVARRMGEAPEGSEGCRRDPRSRRRRRAGGAAGQHAIDGRCSSAISASPTARGIADIPASTGYGEPIQRFFKFKDGERIVGALSLDPRVAGTSRPQKEGEIPPVHARRRLERRLQHAVQPRAVRRAEHPGRQAVRQSGRRRRVCGVARVTGESPDRGDREARADPDARSTKSTFCPGPAGASSSSSCRRTRTACLGSSPRPEIAI